MLILSPTLNKRFCIATYFESGNMIKIGNGMFDLYPILLHVHAHVYSFSTSITKEL